MSYLNFDIGVVMLTAYDEDGFPIVQVDAFGEENSGVVPYEQHSQFGILSRPHDPADGHGCQVLFGMEAGRGHAWVLSDPRVIPLLPPIDKGGSCIYGGNIKAPAFFNIDGTTNSMMFYVPYEIAEDGTPAKAMSISITVDPDGDKHISIVHGDGTAVTLTKDAAIMKNAAGDCYIEVGASGNVINGPTVVQGGSMLGGASAKPLATAEGVVAFCTQLIAFLVTAGVGPLAPLAGATALSTALANIPTKSAKGL